MRGEWLANDQRRLQRFAGWLAQICDENSHNRRIFNSKSPPKVRIFVANLCRPTCKPLQRVVCEVQSNTHAQRALDAKSLRGPGVIGWNDPHLKMTLGHSTLGYNDPGSSHPRVECPPDPIRPKDSLRVK